MKKYLILSMISFFLLSCSNKELSRRKAKKEIIEFYSYPNIEKIGYNASYAGKFPSKVEYLILNSYLNQEIKRNSWFGYVIKLNELSKPYYIDNDGYNYYFAGCELVFKDITGIKIGESGRSATVFYELERKNITPFGDYENNIVSKETNFDLFDDGWRISGEKPKIFIKDSLPNLTSDLKIKPEYETKIKFIGRWYSIKKDNEGCNNVIEIYEEYDAFSADFYSTCNEEEGGIAIGGKIKNKQLIFEKEEDRHGRIEFKVLNNNLIYFAPETKTEEVYSRNLNK